MNIPTQTRKISQRKLFSVQEDRMLRMLVMQYGPRDFKKIASLMPGRSARQVRERYRNYLAPEINNGPWTRQEDELLRAKYAEFGPKWSKISTFFPSRSDVSVKNRWTALCGRSTPVLAPPPPLPTVTVTPQPIPVPYERDEDLPGLFDDGDTFNFDPFSSGYIAAGDWILN